MMLSDVEGNVCMCVNECVPQRVLDAKLPYLPVKSNNAD